MKYCLTTLYDDNFKIFTKNVLKSFEKFCEINKIELKPFDSVLNNNRHQSWNKLLAIEKCLSEYDVVLWCDADSLFVGNLENFFLKNNYNPEIYLMTNKDGNGICLSHFIMNNSQYSFDLIKSLWFLGDVVDDSVFGIGPKWEQNALKSLCQNFKIRPINFFKENTIVDYEYCKRTFPSTFFYHFSVMPNHKRKEYIDFLYESFKHIY
jgi:hypothetical protein